MKIKQKTRLRAIVVLVVHENSALRGAFDVPLDISLRTYDARLNLREILYLREY